MARRPNPNDSVDSLELLLATICNTFGGVLFIAMLICLLSGRPSTPKIDPQQSARNELQSLAALERRENTESASFGRLKTSRMTRDQLDSQLVALSATLGRTPDQIRATALTLSNQRELVTHALQNQKIIDSLDITANQRRRDLATVQSEVEHRQGDLDAEIKATKDVRERNRISLRLPAAHLTTKQQAVAYVHRGRLYAGIYPTQEYQETAPAFRGVAGTDPHAIHPKDLPDTLGSNVITTAVQAAVAIKDQRLSTIDSNQNYIVFAVWPDSYQAFRLLRNEAVRNGIGYGLLLMSEDEPITFGSTTKLEQ